MKVSSNGSKGWLRGVFTPSQDTRIMAQLVTAVVTTAIGDDVTTLRHYSNTSMVHVQCIGLDYGYGFLVTPVEFPAT